MDYKAFYDVFLAEMPQVAPDLNDFAVQLATLQENLQHSDVSNVAPSVYKNKAGTDITYWVGDEDATSVSLIVNTEVAGNFLQVVLTSKNPEIPSGGKPYASDLYLAIQKDIKNLSLTFTSDSLLSDAGAKLWQGIVDRGGKVSVYDTELKQYILSPVTSAEELTKYIGGSSKRRHIFVLSESLSYQRGTITSFVIMEMKRKANWPLFKGLLL